MNGNLSRRSVLTSVTGSAVGVSLVAARNAAVEQSEQEGEQETRDDLRIYNNSRTSRTIELYVGEIKSERKLGQFRLRGRNQPGADERSSKYRGEARADREGKYEIWAESAGQTDSTEVMIGSNGVSDVELVGVYIDSGGNLNVRGGIA